MKRHFFTIIAFLTLTVAYAHLHDQLPASWQLFLQEKEMNSRIPMSNDKDAMLMRQSRFAPTRIINGTEMADVYIDFKNADVIPLLKSRGVIVNCVFDDFLTAQVPINQMEAISKLKGVDNLEVCGVAELCSDSTLSVTKAGQVLNGPSYGLPQAYDGTGVIIGMIDVGYDYQHTAFRRSDDLSKTRIVRVYDPINTTGHPAVVDGNSLPGSIFMDEQIDTLTTDAYETHGTHTTGMAAGRNVNGYGGTAPGADIVMCSSRALHSGLSELELINCIKYIYAYADSVGKPCVINISMSNRFGPHDGTDRVSKAIAQSVGPGRIFVVAAGNNGSDYNYAYGPTLSNKPLNMLIGYFYPPGDDSYFYVNTWMSTWFREINVRPVIQFHILDKKTKHIVWESELISTTKLYTAKQLEPYFQSHPSFATSGYLYGIVAMNPATLKYQATCEFKNLLNKDYFTDSYGNIQSRYQIGVSIYPPSVAWENQPDSSYLDSWICTAYGRRTSYSGPVYRDIVTEEGDTITETLENFYSGSSNMCSIGTYAVNDSIISAGGFISRDSYFSLPDNQTIVIPDCPIGAAWGMSSFEYPGYGPTGKALPTITAPSLNVISAANHLAGINELTNQVVMKEGNDFWSCLTGTSMAAPAVAGIIAQWLQINPNLSPSQIKDIFAQTAIKDDFTNNPQRGYRFGPNGKVDAMAGVRLLLGLDKIIKGDVTGDGVVDIMDITWMIDYLLEIPNPNFVIEAADVFPDGEFNIRDITDTIDMMLDVAF